MKIEQIYTGCLAQGAYYIEDGGEAAVIDPLRETGPYTERAKKSGVPIRYIFETHFHADFVSGHLDLAKETGATIVYGPTAVPGFPALVADDEQVFTLGKSKIKVIHTPGHTMESMCLLLTDENGKDIALFTGDTLFIGDVGRPDLAQKVNASLTQEKLAAHLYHSLRNRIMPLPDHVVIYPAHGAGSACGKKMSSETTDTLGNQKKSNYALRPELTEEQFIREVTEGLTAPPRYFPMNVLMNKQGYDSISDVLDRGLQALEPEAFEMTANASGAIVLDTRKAEDFARAHIPNSINIGIEGNFAPWVGTLIPDIKQQILLVTDEGREEEVLIRLARVGFDHTIGYLKGGMDAWKQNGKEIDTVKRVDAGELTDKTNAEIIDVRRKSEYDSQHVEGAKNLPLDYINENMSAIDRDKEYFVHCAGGYRSMMFISILKARGFDNLTDVRGGFKSMLETGSMKISEFKQSVSDI